MTFTAPEILDILKVCRDTGVQSFRSDSFSVVFGLPVENVVIDPRIPPHWRGWQGANRTNAPLTPPAATVVEPDHAKQSQDTLELEELRAREDQLAELTLTDPERAEEMMIRGELGADEPRSSEEAH